MMRRILLVGVLVAIQCAAWPVFTAAADESLVERARVALADKEADFKPHGDLLAQYADSLRTLDVALAAKCLEVSGIAAFRTNNLDSAMARWQRGVDWAVGAELIRSESSLLNALAVGYTASGDIEGAFPVYDRALEIREALADTMGLSGTWGNLATAYSNLGRMAEALVATAEQAKWLALVDNPTGRVGSAIRSSQILRNLGRYDEAILKGKEAVALADEVGDENVRGMAAMSYGDALLDSGRPDEALPVLTVSRELLLQSGDEFSATFVEQSIISGLLVVGRPEEALTRVRTLSVKVEAAGQLPLLTVLKRFEGMALLELERIAEAESVLVEALALFEERRENLDDDRSRAGIFAASGEIYASLAHCQLATGRPEEAFATVERGRAAVFRDQVDGEVAGIAELQAELAKSNAALILFNDPVYDPLVAFVLDGRGLRVVELGPPDPIAADARAALRLLAAGESLETCQPALTRLEELVSKPILAAVDPGVERFSVVPPSFLAGFPLGLLRDEASQAWSETRPLNYLPNASSMLDLGARQAPPEGVLAFGDPETQGGVASRLPSSPARSVAGVALPEARVEIAAVALKERQRRVGAQASGQELRSAMNTPLAVLHLATHAVVDPVDGGRSAVVMAGAEGFDAVTAQEISTFDFRGDLVVLSGCSTFGGHRVLGEGWFGLPRSFLAAGARTVVSTLWDVDDLGARKFMTEFYAALRAGAARDEALLQARALCREQGMPPREWAAFVLTGVGSENVALLAEQDSGRGRLLLILAAILGGIAGGAWLLGRR
ncbi:MAG: CHAT domain-containing tetratricopeptide repeat protein [Candidatus Krumholzibacteria bacterium]|nr:CHAT domain-containing tetratricopeptide repeat protein [Candidatus Krumholzibacteria bacterium]